MLPSISFYLLQLKDGMKVWQGGIQRKWREYWFYSYKNYLYCLNFLQELTPVIFMPYPERAIDFNNNQSVLSEGFSQLPLVFWGLYLTTWVWLNVNLHDYLIFANYICSASAFFWPHHTARRIPAPRPGTKPAPPTTPQWKHRVSTTGPPGKSPRI